MTIRFDTKIAIAVRADLEPWQKLNVTAFLASGVAASKSNPITRSHIRSLISTPPRHSLGVAYSVVLNTVKKHFRLRLDQARKSAVSHFAKSPR